MNFWITVSVPTIDYRTAERIAARIADRFEGEVIQVDQEPPQGALIVGDHHEDSL